MTPPAKNRYQHLFDDPEVKRWYDNLARGSQATADVYLRRVGSFCEDLKTTPKGLTALDELKLYNIMLDCVSSMEKSEYTGSYIESV